MAVAGKINRAIMGFEKNNLTHITKL